MKLLLAVVLSFSILLNCGSTPQPTKTPGTSAPIPKSAPQGVSSDSVGQPKGLSFADVKYDKFTHYQRGDLPIIISAPHGGKKEIPGVSDRVSGVTVLDSHTREVALALNDELIKKFGKRPYLVVADFTRKHVDANRPSGEAYENSAAGTIYDFYHGRVREFVDEIKSKFKDKSILLDIHGQAASSTTIFRGTRNSKTVKKLIERAGINGFIGPTSVLGYLANKGYTVEPRDATTRENPHFVGGFIVENYGSHNDNGIDAIQMELGLALRSTNANRFIKDLADAIKIYYDAHLVK